MCRHMIVITNYLVYLNSEKYWRPKYGWSFRCPEPSSPCVWSASACPMGFYAYDWVWSGSCGSCYRCVRTEDEECPTWLLQAVKTPKRWFCQQSKTGHRWARRLQRRWAQASVFQQIMDDDQRKQATVIITAPPCNNFVLTTSGIPTPPFDSYLRFLSFSLTLFWPSKNLTTQNVTSPHVPITWLVRAGHITSCNGDNEDTESSLYLLVWNVFS